MVISKIAEKDFEWVLSETKDENVFNVRYICDEESLIEKGFEYLDERDFKYEIVPAPFSNTCQSVMVITCTCSGIKGKVSLTDELKLEVIESEFVREEEGIIQ